MLLTCTSHVLSWYAPDLCSANKFYNMPANIITTDDLRQFKIELLDELKQLFGHRAETNTREYLKSSEVSKLLDISLSKLQHMRIRKVLPYTRIGSTIYYKREDIQTLLEANRKQAKVKSLSLFQKWSSCQYHPKPLQLIISSTLIYSLKLPGIHQLSITVILPCIFRYSDPGIIRFSIIRWHQQEMKSWPMLASSPKNVTIAFYAKFQNSI